MCIPRGTHTEVNKGCHWLANLMQKDLDLGLLSGLGCSHPQNLDIEWEVFLSIVRAIIGIEPSVCDGFGPDRGQRHAN